MTPEQLLALVAARSVAVSEPVGGAKPEWTLVELGFVSAGLRREQMEAFWWRHARDVGVVRSLGRRLLAEVREVARREGWPRLIGGRDYVPELVVLAIAEEQLSDLDKQRLRDRLEGHWPDGEWGRQLSRRYRVVGSILDGWCMEAHWHMVLRMREDTYEG